MLLAVEFRSYQAQDEEACLELLRANTPDFFSPHEADEYRDFLREAPPEYEVCLAGSRIIGAFGLCRETERSWRIRWILLHPELHGQGVGTAVMSRFAKIVAECGGGLVRIAASQKSAPFFEKFGARIVSVTKNGWGPTMHRIDMQWAL